MKKIKIIVPTIAGIVFVFFYVIGGFPVIIMNEDAIERYENANESLPICMDSVMNPLEGMDFSTGNNELFLIFSLSDSDKGNLPAGILRRKVLSCKDNNVLQEFQNRFNIKISGGDACTLTTRLLIYKAGELVFAGFVDIDSHSKGIQSPIYGWAKFVDAEKVLETMSKFKPYRGVVLLLD